MVVEDVDEVIVVADVDVVKDLEATVRAMIAETTVDAHLPATVVAAVVAEMTEEMIVVGADKATVMIEIAADAEAMAEDSVMVVIDATGADVMEAMTIAVVVDATGADVMKATTIVVVMTRCSSPSPARCCREWTRGLRDPCWCAHNVMVRGKSQFMP